MKKIIAIAVIAIVSLAGVFAAAGSSAAVRLNGKVDETAYTPSLYYVVSDGKAESVGTSLYDIADGDSRWDLTKDGETNDFIVKVTGNMVFNFGGQVLDANGKVSVDNEGFKQAFSMGFSYRSRPDKARGGAVPPASPG